MKIHPRISIIKLIEYNSALPSRQREIVDDQKNPLANKPKITWCANARRAIMTFLYSGCSDLSILDEEVGRLHLLINNLDEKNEKRLKSKIRKIEVDIEAINAFQELCHRLDAKSLRYTKVAKKPKYLDYSGVHVSIRPDMIVTSKTSEPIGCLKLYLTKNDRLKDDDADFLCAVLNHYSDRYLASNQTSQAAACMVIDVFGRKIYSASERASFHAGQIRKSCEQIREIWPSIPLRKPVSGKDEGDEFNFSE